MGKSTLFNRLVGRRQAIVDSTAGTTRDRHYGKTDWNGKEFSVIDTGGYTVNSDDVFEDEIRRQVLLAIEEADVILVGVSRTSKTPTCIYLAHRGIRAANVPLVPGQEDGERLTKLKNPLVIGLTVSPDRLVQIRRNRIDNLNASQSSNYTDQDAVRDETIKARRAFERRGWPTIDVTRRSVEETAAAITNLLSEHRNHKIGTTW